MRAWTIAWLFAVLSGCTCNGPGVASRKAELVWVLSSGVETGAREAQLSFPDTPMGQTSGLLVRVRNIGLGSAQLKSLALVDGSAAFTSSLPALTNLDPGAESELELTFSPPLEGDATETNRRHAATLELEADGTSPDQGSLRLSLEGLALTGDCALPASVDFGELPVLSSATAQVPLALSTGEQRLEVARVEGADADAFTIDPATLSLRAPGGRVPVQYTAREARAYAATLRWRRGAHCPWANTRLLGAGSDDAVTLEPRTVDFGDVPLQQEAARIVTLRARAGVPLPISSIALEGAGFLNSGAAATELPSRGAVAIDVRCAPTTAGALTGTLRVTLASQPPRTLSAALSCRGGGPRLRLAPSGIVAFGVVPYLNGVITQTTRRLSVTNVGNPAPAPPLLLGRGGGQLPYFAFAPVLGPTTDWQVHVPSTYRPELGLPATAGSSAELTVAFRPAQLGRREVDLLVYSNDAVSPVSRIRLTAEGRASDGCTVSLQPAALDFGALPPGADVTQTVTVRNTSLVACTLSSVELSTTTASVFSIESASTAQLSLRPAETAVLSVRARVPANAAIGANFEGTLRVFTSDVARRQVDVPLTATASTCIVLSPSTLDFGATRPFCRTASRTAYLYNTCGVPVTLHSVATTPTPFVALSTPAIPAQGLTLQAGAAPRPLQLTYAPQGEGQHTGAVDLGLSVAGASRQLTLQLRGRAAAEPLVEERFTQPAVTQTDLLFTIDNSCSMQDEQASLAANLSAFLGHATSRNLDFQLGVTTTDDDVTGARGRLVSTPTNPKLLRRDTPQLQALFAEKVLVGTSGSGMEMPLSTTVKALTPPLIDGPNAGLLRPDAALGVIIVTDAIDQSPEPLSAYVDRLLGVKGDAQRFLVSVSVVGPFTAMPGCASEGQLDTGRFRTLVDQSGGVRAEICTTQWAQDLARIAEATFGARRRFPLSNRPEVSRPISVSVDGIPAPDAGLDAVTNAIDFGQAPPQAGATVTVRYTPACF